MTNIATDVNTALTKFNTLLTLIPQLNTIALNSLLQVNGIFGAAGLPAVSTAAITAINKQLTDALTLAGDIGMEASAIVNLVTSFVGSFETLAGQAQAAIAQAHAAASAPAPAPVA